MSAKQIETYTTHEAHTLNDKEVLYIQSMTPEELQLHELAVKMLGTSYFVGKTHGYTKWLKEQPQQGKK
jgi:hypothetical protein